MSSVPRCPASTTGSVSPAGWRRGCSSCSARPICSSRAAAPVAYRRSADAAGRSRLLSPAPAVVLLPVGHVVAGCLQRLPLVACLRHRRLVAAVEQHRAELEVCDPLCAGAVGEEQHLGIVGGIVGGKIGGAVGGSIVGDRQPHRLALGAPVLRSEEHTSELQTLMRISFSVVCLTKTNKQHKK